MGHDTAGAEQPVRSRRLNAFDTQGTLSQENGTANHAEHAKGGGALQVQDDAFDLEVWLAEIEQQAEMQARRFQIIQALHPMNLIDPLRRLQFDQNVTFNERVNRIVPDHDPIVSNGHAMLL